MSNWRPSRRLLIGALPPALTLAAVAYELGVTKNTIDNWRRRDVRPLPAYKRADGTWVVGTEALRSWLGLAMDGQ